MGEPLISKADETRRERVLSRDEESRLLDACGDRTITYSRRGKKVTANIKSGQRKHLRALIICAVDTGMRRGEMFKLRWRDVDFASRSITVIAENSKTARARVVGMTSRLHEELEKLWLESPQDDGGIVFGITNSIKKAFGSACEEAGIEGLHFHDLRHTAITRMVNTVQPTAIIMKISGHTQHATFARYVNPGADAITNVAEALSALNGSVKAQEEVKTIN
jgi:integrase